MARFRKNQAVWYDKRHGELLPENVRANFYGYDGGGMARIWIFNVGRRTVPVAALSHREEVTV